jgi:ligand-binding SRPBCC domain-containing protein
MGEMRSQSSLSKPGLMTHHLNYNIWLPRPIEEVFSFFANARNLGAITPRWPKFRIISSGPIMISIRARISYRPCDCRVRLHGKAKSPPGNRHTVSSTSSDAVPCRLWKHEHTFSAKDNGTEVADHGAYSVPGGRAQLICSSWLGPARSIRLPRRKDFAAPALSDPKLVILCFPARPLRLRRILFWNERHRRRASW